MSRVVSAIGSLLKVGLAVGIIFGMVGLVGLVGVCAVTDLDCIQEKQPETAAAGQSVPQETDTFDTETPQRETESPDTAEPTEHTPTQTEQPQIVGPDPPPYPPRTEKEWDRELSFRGDPGETIAEGENWRVSSEDVERFIAEDVNEYRIENGKAPLVYSHALANVSRAHSEDMWDRGYFAHENPDGERAWDRLGSGHCRGLYGENLVQTWANAPLQGGTDYLRTADELAQRAVQNWKDSPPHDEAMRRAGWDAVGYGVYFVYSDDDDGSYKMYVTMNMCEYNDD